MATTAAFWSKLTTAQASKTLPRIVTSGQDFHLKRHKLITLLTRSKISLFVMMTSGQGSHLEISGSQYLNFCSSHYLGFAEEPRLKKAAHNAIDQYGLGTGYRTLAGTHALHVELEERIAAFKG